MGLKMKKRTICYFSEIGNKNFFYPSNRKGIVLDNAEYEALPWLCNNRTLQAIKVKNKYIVPLTNTEDCISISNVEQFSVVWTKKQV